MKKWLLGIACAILLICTGQASVFAYDYEDGSAEYPYYGYAYMSYTNVTEGQSSSISYSLSTKSEYVDEPYTDDWGYTYYGYYRDVAPKVIGCSSSDESIAKASLNKTEQSITVKAKAPGEAIIYLDYCYEYSYGVEYYRAYTYAYVQEKPRVAIYDCKIKLSQKKFNYTKKKAYKPTVKITYKDETTGKTKTLKKGRDYKLSYENNKKIGVGRVIIEGIGNYKGYKVEKFGILPKKATNIKVKSPHKNEATVTWNKVTGADGFYVYRKIGNGKMKYIANITDGDYQVFHDINIKAGKKCTYQIVPYVKDDFYDEAESGDTYVKPTKKEESDDDYWYYWWYGSSEYEDSTSYYSEISEKYAAFTLYNYSCVKGKCTKAFTAPASKKAGCTVTSKTDGKRRIIYMGDASYDYMIYLLDKKIITKDMNDEQRVKAIFNWMVKNCEFTKDIKDYEMKAQMKQHIDYNSKSFKKKAEKYEKTVQKKIKTGEALCIGTNLFDYDRGFEALSYWKGSCSYLTPMFNMLCNGAGVEAYLVSGDFINSDGSRQFHNFSFVNLNGKYYWYDTPIAVRHPNSKSSYYKKGTKDFMKHHEYYDGALNGFSKKMFVE